MKKVVVIGISLWLGVLTCLLGAGEPTEVRPNLVFILVDDQRNDTLGCAGHPVIETPHIDQLAAQGVRFQNAYVSMPICMASRATIFTGLTYTSHGYTAGGPPSIPLQEMDIDTAFPTQLREAGYRTAFYGKNHVQCAESVAVAFARMFEEHKFYNGGPHFVKAADGRERHSAEVIGDHAIRFINSQGPGRPFCVYLSFNIAHAVDNNHEPGAGHFPWPKAVDGMYENIEHAPPRLGDARYFEMQPTFLKESLNRDRWFWRWDTPDKYRINMRAYFRMLSGMDGVIGRVQEALRDQDLEKNTVVIYTSDNGFYMGERGFAGKWSHYEESLRVPMIIFDPRPSFGERGRVVESLVTNLDLPATILDLAEVEIPKKYQGESLVPFLRGETPEAWREDFFTEHYGFNPRLPTWHGVHNGRITYARYEVKGSQVSYLHDLETDPDQLVNLALEPQHAALLKKMSDRTDAYLRKYTRPEITRIRENQNSRPSKR